MTCKEFSSDVLSAIEPFVYEWTSQHKGSISAEHGLGWVGSNLDPGSWFYRAIKKITTLFIRFKKRNYIGYTKSPSAVNIMHSIKKLFDPNNILNPYKTLPDL